MDEMSNYVASGWKRDLTYIIGCCWAAQVGSLDRDKWHVAIHKFLAVMVKPKASEWTDIKELTPLQFMPYMAKLFREVTGKDLQCLSQFTGWIGQGGYYHWRVAQQGLIHLVPHLQGWPMPRTPNAHPSGQPLPPRLARTETQATGASGKQQDRTPGRSGQGSTSNQGGKPSTSGQCGKSTVPSQGGKSSTPRQSSKLASTSGGGIPAASGGPVDPPPGRGGVGDSTWTDWYQMTMRRARGGISEPQGPPYPIRMAEARQEAFRQIYDRVDGKDLPPHNIASEALRAYYTRVDPQTLNTWVCQILCMISEYHMACVTRGPLVTSSIVPRELEDRLPPLADYASPEDQSGTTDVRVRDHWARTLRVAVWCHWLDMALSEEPASSGSLVRSRHQLRCLLAYFLGPGTAWELQFKDVVTQVLKENLRHIKKRCTNAASSLRRCNKWQTKLRTEFDATSKAMQVVTDAPSSRVMEHRLSSLQTSLNVIERSMMRYENLIEDCRMQEEEISHEQEEEEATDAEMVDEEEHDNPEPSDPHGEADTEGPPPLDPIGDAVSPEEDAFLMQLASQSEDPTAGSHSPRSETGTVSGEMAKLSLTSLSQPGPGEDKTQL